MSRFDQNGEETITEEDTTGRCQTVYRAQQPTGQFKVRIQKSKDLSQCSHGRYDTQSVGYNPSVSRGGEANVLSLLKGKKECEQFMSHDNVLAKSQCREKLTLNGALGQETGKVVTDMYQTLDYVSHQRFDTNYNANYGKDENRDRNYPNQNLGMSIDAPQTRPQNIPMIESDLAASSSFYEERYSIKQSNTQPTKDILYDMAQDTKDVGIQPESPHKFLRLVESVRTLSTQAIQDLYHELKSLAAKNAKKSNNYRNRNPNNNQNGDDSAQSQSRSSFRQNNENSKNRNRNSHGNSHAQWSVESIHEKAYKHYIDAIPMAQTLESIGAIVKLYESGAVTRGHAKYWIIALSFIPEPTIEMINALNPLMSAFSSDDSVTLAYSSLLNNLARTNPFYQDLQNVPEARELHNYIAQTLTHSCSGSSYADRKAEKAFAALKSLGNLGFSPNLIPHVVTCFQNQYVPHKLKVAAVESLRKMPCQAQKHLLDLFSQGNDAEIRMRAFLLIHQCPTPAALHEIRETLRHEANRDVATLVYSFYKNVNESTDPQKEMLRLMVGEMNMLGAIEPHVEQILNNANYYTDANDANNKNNGNQRQQSENPQYFSKYFEQSFHNDLVNSGFVSEGHIFYYQDRINSARLALKANVFGINYNLIDVALDLETTALLTNELNILAAQANSQSSQQNNLNQNALLNLLQLQSAQSSQQQNQLSNNIQRRKRQNAGQKNNNRSNRLEESLPEVGSKLISSLLKILTDPSLDKAQALGSLKLGGKEILFWDILGSDIQNIMSDPVSALQKLKQFSKYRETSFTESTLLADNSAIVTTGLGFPLNITIKSAAVTDIGIMGFVDMNNLVLNQEIQLKGTIKPSAAVYVQASVSLMGISLSGVGVSTLIHTNSELGIHMHYSLSSGMKYKLTLPDRKMDVLQIQNQVFSIASNGEMLDTTRLHSNEACTGPKVEKAFGLEACLSYQYPSALATGSAFKKEGQFPTGIFGAGITLEKIDPTIEHYEISVKSSKQDEAKYRVKVHVETPGSKNSHTTDLDGRFDLDQKTMKVDLKSELGIWDITGQYREESPKRTTTHLTFINGKQQVYDHKMAIEINENKETWTEDIGFVYDITYPNKNAPAHYIFKMSSTLDNDLMKRPAAKNHPLSQYSRSFKGAIIRPNTFQATFEGSTVKSLTSYDLKFETEYSTKTLQNQRLFIKKYMQYDRKRVAHNMRYKSEMESTQFPALNHEIEISSQLDTADHDGSLGNGLKNYHFYGDYSTNDDAKWSNITVSVRNDSSNHGAIADQNLHIDVKYDSSEDEKVNGNAIVKIHIERDNEAQNAQRSRNYANAQGHNPYDDDEDSIRQLKSHVDLHVDFNTKEYPDHKILGQFDFERIKMQGAYQNANSDRNSAYPGYESDEPKHKWYSRGQLQKFPRAQTSGANRSPGSNSRLNRRKNIWQKIVYSLNPNRPSESDENQYMAAIDTDNSNYLAYEILVTPLSHFRATIDFDFGEGPNYYKAEFVNTSPFRNSKNMTLLIEAYDKDQMEQNANGPSQAEHESQIAEIQTEQNALSEENVGKQRLYATYVRTPDSSAAKLNVHFVDNEGEVYDVFYKHQIYINEQNDDRNGLVMLTTTLPWDSVRNIDMLAQLSVRNKQLQGKLKYTQDDFKIMGNVVGTKSEKSIDAQFNATTSLESAKEIVFNVHSEKTESQWSHKTELLMYDQSHHEKRSSIKIIVQTDPRFKIVVKIQPTLGMPEMDLFISTENEAEIIFKIVSHQGSKFYFKTVLPPKLLELIDSNVDRNQYSQRARQNHRFNKQRSQLQQKTLYANQNNDDNDFNLIEYIPVKVETSFKVILSTYTLSHGFVFSNEPQHLYFNWNAQVSPVMPRRIEWELDVKMNDRDISARTKLQLTRKTVVIELDHDDQRENDKLKSQTNMKFYPDHENIPTRFISFDSHANGILVSSGPNYGLRKKVVINISSIIADSLKVDKPIKTQTTLTLHDAETIVNYESEVIYDEGKSFLVKLNFKDASRLRLSRVIGDLSITKPNSKLDWKVRGNYETSVSKPYKKYNIDSSYLMDNGEIRKLDIDYISDPEKDLHKFNFQLDNSDLMAKVFINTKKPSYMVIIQTGDPHDPKDSHTSVINYNVNTKVFDVKFLDSLYLRAAIETDDKALVDLYILDPNVSAPKASDPNNWGQNLQDQLPAYSLVAILNNTRTVHLHSKWEKDAPDKVEKIMKKSGHRLSHLLENGVHHLIEDIIKKLRRSGVDIVTQASDTPIEQLNSLCKQIKQHIQNRYLQADPKSNNRRLYNNNANRQRHQMQSTNTNGAADILSAILEVFPDIAEDLSLLKHQTIRAIATQKSLKYKLQYLWNQILEVIRSFYSNINDLKQSVFRNEPNSVGQLLSSILNRNSQSSVQALLRRVQKAFSAANYQNNEESQFLSSLSKGILPNHPLISMFAYAFANFKNAEPDLQQEPFKVFNDERRGAASRQINWDSIYNEESRFDGTDKLAEYAANNNYERLSQAPSQLRQQRQTDNDESSDLADENPIDSARNAIFARKDYRDKMRQDEALIVNYLRIMALGVPLLTNMYWPQINVNTDMKDESQIDVTLPFKWESFKHMPDLEDFVGIKALVKILKTLKEGLGFGHYADRYDSWDFILNSEHQDPVKMHFGAALINGTSILSWDKNLYHVNQFPSSYILARDTNNQLHVVVSPRNPNKQNRQNQASPRWSASASNENAIQIDIKIANKDVITVAQNGVFVNDIQVQFPTKHGNFEILSAVDRYIAYNEKEGYMLIYYIDDNTFVFTASQAHANQFSGLFGTNNGNFMDDFTTASGKNLHAKIDMASPNKESIHNLRTFINSWELNHYNRQHPKLPINLQPEARRTTKKLEAIYYSRHALQNVQYNAHDQRITKEFISEYSSQLRNCHPIYTPDILQDVLDAAQAYGKQEGLCKTIQALTLECFAKNVHLELPKECVTCQVGNQLLKEDDTMPIQQMGAQERKIHIVYMIEEAYDVKETESDILRSVKELNNELKEKHSVDGRNIKYTVVGFGNPKYSAIQRYYSNKEGETTFEMDDFENVWKNIKFTDRTLPQPLDVIFLVSKEMDFAPNTIRVMQLISHRRPSHDKRIDSGSVFQALKDQSIMFNALVKCPLEYDEKTNYPIGFDRDSIFFAEHSNDNPILGDVKAYSHTRKCKGLIVDLAKRSDGVVFDHESLRDRPSVKKSVGKDLTKVMARVIAQKTKTLPAITNLIESQTYVCAKNALNDPRLLAPKDLAQDGNEFQSPNVKRFQDSQYRQSDRDFNLASDNNQRNWNQNSWQSSLNSQLRQQQRQQN